MKKYISLFIGLAMLLQVKPLNANFVFESNGTKQINQANLILADSCEITLTTNVFSAPCFGGTGFAAVSAFGGFGDYDYVWDDPSGQTEALATGLLAGVYTVTVSDTVTIPQQCFAVALVVITQPDSLILTLTGTGALSDTSCTGTVTASAIGGTGTISFMWSDPEAQAGPTATGLCAGTYTVSVIDANFCLTTTDYTVNNDGPCAGPSNLTVTNLTSHSATLNWDGTNSSYQVIGSKLGSPPVTFTTSDKELDVASLMPSTGYYWTVVSICPDTMIAAAITDTFFTLSTCETPTSLSTINIGEDSAVFSWTASPNALGYRIAVAEFPVNPSLIFFETVLAPNTSYILKQLTPGKTYVWRMISLCGNNKSALSSVQTFTTNVPVSSCAVPQNLLTDSITDNCATLNWDAVAGAVGYNIKGNAVGAPPIDEFNIIIMGTEFPLTGLNSAISYWWTVRAICSLTDTNEVSIFAVNDTFTTTTSALCATPQNIYTDSITDNCAVFNWDPVPGAIGYELNADAVGVPFGSASFVIVLATTSFDFGGLNMGISYWWTVRAICDISGTNLSGFAPIDTFTTLSMLCPVPSNLFTDSITNGSAELIWAPVTEAIGYVVQGNAVGADSTTIFMMTTTNTSFTLTGLNPNISYWWSVASICDLTTQSPFAIADTFSTLTFKRSSTMNTENVSQLKVAPNPASEYFMVESSAEIDNMMIYDVNGQLWSEIMKPMSVNGKFRFDTALLPAGVYFLHLEHNDHTQVRKVVVME